MKIISRIVMFVAGALMVTSCGLDNFDEPKSFLSGEVTYQGKALGVRGTSGAVQLQLYQDGYEKHDPITVYVGQDGKFSASLFDGEYRLVTKPGNGPWLAAQEQTVNVKGSTTCKVEVTPYFTISNANISLNGSVASCTATVDRVVNDAKLSDIFLLVSTTSFVDEGTYIARQKMDSPAEGAVSLSVDMSNNEKFASAKHLFARLGVRAAQADQAIYSEVIQLK